MKGDVLVLNSGSSSIKFGLYAGDDVALPLLGHGQIEGINAVARLNAVDRNGESIVDEIGVAGGYRADTGQRPRDCRPPR